MEEEEEEASPRGGAESIVSPSLTSSSFFSCCLGCADSVWSDEGVERDSESDAIAHLVVSESKMTTTAGQVADASRLII